MTQLISTKFGTCYCPHSLILQCENGRNRKTTTPISHIIESQIGYDSFSLQFITQASVNISEQNYTQIHKVYTFKPPDTEYVDLSVHG